VTRISSGRPDLPLLIGLFGGEISLVALALGLHAKGDRPFVPFLRSTGGELTVAAVLLGGIAAAVVVGRLRRGPAVGGWLTLGLNAVSVAGTLAAAELAVRILTVATWAGPMFAGTLLLPRDWAQVAARHRDLAGRASLHGSYFIFDDRLGWTVGPSRRDASGLYFSSLEGLRSPQLGVSLAERRAQQRVALVGDSFTFGLELPWEDTWAAQLQAELGEDTQVLNFGVDGYGVDQAFLRYQRDARAWHPDVVVLGLVDHDFERTMGVYAFLTFPQSQLPFSKPRFVADDGLELLNTPVPAPAAIFGAGSVRELPFIEYDRRYRSSDWQWRFYHASSAVRFLLSRFPRWTAPGRWTSNEQLETVNRRLLRSFVDLAQREGSTPVLLYLPGPSRLQAASPAVEESLAERLARAEGLPIVDATPCLTEVPGPERFGILHYSRRASAAVVKCLLGPLRERLGAARSRLRAGS
jgi:hypothetical protein